jgi:predicted dehydrogenase
MCGLFELESTQQTPDLLQVLYEYPGFIVQYEVMCTNAFGNSRRTPGRLYFYPNGEEDVPHGILFYGSNGTLFLDRYGYEVFPELVPRDKAKYRMDRSQQFETEPKRLHCQHFIDCLRDRKKPSADVEIGQRSTTLTHLGAIAYKTGKKLHWDAAREQFPDEPQANQLLAYEMRGEYRWI